MDPDRILRMRWSILIAIMVAVVGCRDSPSSGSSSSSGTGEEAPLTLRIDGSTTAHEAVQKLAERFMALDSATRPGFRIEVKSSASGTGIHKLIAGEIDIAASSRALLRADLDLAGSRGIPLKSYEIAYDALCIIVPPQIYESVRTISIEQLRAIFFDGTITDWSQLDGSLSGTIHFYIRDQDSSGTAETFTSLITGASDTPYAAGGIARDRTPMLTAAVAGDPQGLTAVPFRFVDQRVRALAVEDASKHAIPPTLDNIRNLNYPLKRDIFLITRGTPKGVAGDFLRFVLSLEGQAIINTSGLTSFQ